MSARQHHCVFGSGEAHDTLTLGFISNVGCGVVNAVDIVHLEDSIVILIAA